MKSYVLFALFLSLLFAPPASRADLMFTFAQPIVSAAPNSSFDLDARLFNTGDPNDPNALTYNVDHYTYTVTPSTLVLPDDLTDDPTPFLTNFQRTFAPGDDSGLAWFVFFTVGPNAPSGMYDVAFELQDTNNTALAQQSFTLDITSVPESAPVVVGIALLITIGGIRQRRFVSGRTSYPPLPDSGRPLC